MSNAKWVAAPRRADSSQRFLEPLFFLGPGYQSLRYGDKRSVRIHSVGNRSFSQIMEWLIPHLDHCAFRQVPALPRCAPQGRPALKPHCGIRWLEHIAHDRSCRIDPRREGTSESSLVETRPRQPRARARMPNPSCAGHTWARVGRHHWTLPARQADRQFGSLSLSMSTTRRRHSSPRFEPLLAGSLVRTGERGHEWTIQTILR